MSTSVNLYAATAAAWLLVVTSAAGARAQCAFNHSPTAKSLTLSLVRAMEGCPSAAHPGFNATTSGGLSACTPPIGKIPFPYSFAEGSKCEVRIVHKRDPDCDVGPTCSKLVVSARCSGVITAPGTPISGPGWRLRINLRLTGDDYANGDMTIVDAPIGFDFPPARNGVLKLKGTLDNYGFNGYTLPACVSSTIAVPPSNVPEIDLIDAVIIDPLGGVFASPGVALGTDAAACTVKMPERTKGIRGSLVRAFAACPTASLPVNASTGDGVPSCAPPQALSPNRYDDRSGGCKVSITRQPGNCDPPCTRLSFKLNCTGVLQSDGVTPIDESGWRLRFIARASTDDASAGAVTVVDLPVEIALPPFTRGRLLVDSVVTELDAAIPPPNTLALGACTSVEVVDLMLLDASGNAFARLGTASFPK